MRALSIFSGCGGMDIAAEWAGIEILLQCEIDDNCQRILDRHWPDVKKWKDVRTLDADDIINEFGTIDLIFGGPPCQPVSVAGRREAAGDARNMWGPYLDLIRGVRPRWVVAENPTGILSAPYRKGEPKGTFFGSILREMDEMGYVVGWGVWGACDVEHDEEGTPLPPQSAGCAPHQRERVFIVANNPSIGQCAGMLSVRNETQYPKLRSSSAMADASSARLLPATYTRIHRGETRPRTRNEQPERCRDVGNTCRAGCEERNAPAISGYTGYIAGECTCGIMGNPERCGSPRLDRRRTGPEPPNGHAVHAGRAQPGLGGDAHGPAHRLDFAGWPAGRGAEQFVWEPPRVVPGGTKGRGARLKMLGNMVMPYQALPVFEEIVRANR